MSLTQNSRWEEHHGCGYQPGCYPLSTVVHYPSRRDGCTDGRNGVVSDGRGRSLRPPFSPAAHFAGAHGTPDAQAAVRDRGGAWSPRAVHPHTPVLGGGTAACA